MAGDAGVFVEVLLSVVLERLDARGVEGHVCGQDRFDQAFAVVCRFLFQVSLPLCRSTRACSLFA